MRTSDFDYHLPQELIAQTPLELRDASRLLVLYRSTGRIEHTRFTNIMDYLRPGDLMVFNQSRVIPARLYGRRADTGGRVELLLLNRESPGVWRALARPGRRLRPGDKVVLEAPSVRDGERSPQILPFVLGGARGFDVEILSSEEDGIKRVRLTNEDAIDSLGSVPLPPYIHRRLDDPERYQTVYARQPGSVAAPTAGLHFTEPLMEQLRAFGVELAFVTLHVGLDTFRPVQDEDPSKHRIHTEYFDLSAKTAAALNRARAEGRRIIAVGTTSVRVLEHVAQRMADGEQQVVPSSGQADLFILPGHRFRMVDAMLTNFHLPRSTLLMLVSAFAGREQVLNAYQEAIQEKYRFYSFGDCMLML
ncbi:MAG: tRNA preQ1(34) S-adenosylmethionine ribosyltransferase-isomerase QueA [Chloroflexi bacterium]|nr:tRNA preQ1(34) S-adenosylmethionine ribosyltransferase-isomerase QueA [Chloroflexota bacterium]